MSIEKNNSTVAMQFAAKKQLNYYLNSVLSNKSAFAAKKEKLTIKRALNRNLPYQANMLSPNAWLKKAIKYLVAAGLLASSAMPVLADFSALPSQYNEFPASTNPFSKFLTQGAISPKFIDVDTDGDLDMLASSGYGGSDAIRYFRNDGDAQSPDFNEISGADNPFSGASGNTVQQIAVADIDNDGDDDVIVVANGGSSFWLNNGDGSFDDSATNPIAAVPVGGYPSAAFGDVDGDGDLDLAIAESGNIINYFENTGSAEVANFSATPSSLFSSFASSYYPAVDLQDIDGDGDIDLMVGNYDTGAVEAYENNNNSFTADNTIFSKVAISEGGWPMPDAGDLDGDGLMDLVVGGYTGIKYYKLADAPILVQGPFFQLIGESNPFNGVDLGWSAVPSFADIDNDGDMDAIMGEYFDYEISAARIFYMANNDGTFELQAGEADPFDGLAFPWPDARTAPAVVDIDNDGDMDVVTGSRYGYTDMITMENVGTASAADFVKSSNDAFAGLGGFWWSKPAFVDIDGDGDQDAFIGEYYGSIQYFENVGTSETAIFENKTASDMDPLSGEILDSKGEVVFENGISLGKSKPIFTDYDNDGDMDLVVGSNANIVAFENTGSNDSANFVKAVGNADPFFLIGSVTGQASPAFVDIDGDGDEDMVVGNVDGQFQVWERNSSPIAGEVSASVVEGESVYINMTANTTDVDSDKLTAKLMTAPANGEVLIDYETGQFRYFPAPSFVGTDTFTFMVEDDRLDNNGKANPAMSKIATATITVSAATKDTSVDNGGSFGGMLTLLTLPLLWLRRKIRK